MAKTDLSWVNAVDTSTFKAASAADSLPVENLATPRYGRVWRSLLTTSWFTVTFAAVTQIDIVALAAATLGAADSVRHRLFDAAGATLLDVTVSAGVLPGYALHVYTLAASINAASWRCDITATSRVSNGYFDIGRAWAGPKWRPAVGIDFGWDETWNDDANNMRGKISGALFVGDGALYRSANVNLGFMGDTDKAQAKELSRLSGRRSQVLIVPDQDGDVPREAILGRIDKMQPEKNLPGYVPPLYSQAFSLIQDL
jgi:hypothetical protein